MVFESRGAILLVSWPLSELFADVVCSPCKCGRCASSSAGCGSNYGRSRCNEQGNLSCRRIGWHTAASRGIVDPASDSSEADLDLHVARRRPVVREDSDIFVYTHILELNLIAKLSNRLIFYSAPN